MLNLPQHKKKPECGTVVLGGSSKALRQTLALAGDGKVCLATPTPALVSESPILSDDFSNYSEYYDNLNTLISEVLENENITVLRNASVDSLDPLRLISHSLYVNSSRCDGCGDCLKACPVSIPDFTESGLVGTHPVARKPGEGENAGVVITRLEQPYCQASCPIAMDARGYIGRIADGEIESANEIIARTNPLPEVCGKICTHFCESTCARAAMDEPVQVRNIKRFAAERNTECFDHRQKRNIDEANKVAVIGSGPAGLAAAADLAAWGYPVTIFEALQEAGGMLKAGIPEFRLSDDTILKELENITALGVEIRLNSPVGIDLTISQLLGEHGYKAVFISVGAHESIKLRIEGEDLPGVHAGVDFLRQLNLGDAPEIGKKVVVIGGGNVAVDTARAARRLGAEAVTILYRRTRAEMPAYPEEVEQALEEGIIIEYLTAPVRILKGEGMGLKTVECIRMELGEPDESGRKRPVPIKGSEYPVEADAVISAIGQSVRPDFLEGMGDIKLNPNGTIAVDAASCATSMERVYAGGDGSRGPASVIEAIADGKRAASSIDGLLRGCGERDAGFEPIPESFYIDGENKPTELQLTRLAKYQNQLIAGGSAGQGQRIGVRELGVEERVKGFAEVELGLTAEHAAAEAERCLGCRLCIGCGICAAVCPKNAIDFTLVKKGIELESERSYDLRPVREKYILPSMLELYKNSYNVITAMELEVMLNPGGAYGGQIMRPYDGEIPKSIVFVDVGGAKNVKSKMPGSGNVENSKVGHGIGPMTTVLKESGSLHIARLAIYVKKNYPGCEVKLLTDHTRIEEVKELGEAAVSVPDLAIEEDPGTFTFTITHSSGKAEESFPADLIVITSVLEPQF